ncbi:YsnF/AvaK domain-containing protein [Paracoccus sediminis]|nr:YsnF/AvaK domain-containing protein [Paracoccus sediminis]SNR48377.1 protein of unknown function [Paracoccus sediminis]
MTDDPQILPVVKEELVLTKEQRLAGRVRVSTRTEAVDQMLSVDLTETQVEVVRVPVDRRIQTVPEVVTKDGVTIVPVVEERLVVTRELYLLEEVHIRHVEQRRTQEVPVTTRHQTVHVQRVPVEPGASASNSVAKDQDDDS